MVLEDKPRLGKDEVQNFQVHSNAKWIIYSFFINILCCKNLWFGSKFSFRGQTEVRFSKGLESSRFGIFRFIPSLKDTCVVKLFSWSDF